MPDLKRPAESYARLYDDVLDNPKIATLAPSEFGLWCAMVSYSHRNDTDGLVPYARARGLLDFNGRGFVQAVRHLREVGLLEEQLTGFFVHDYPLHNETHAERNARRNAARNAARIRWASSEQIDSDAPSNAESMPRRRNKEKENKLENKESKRTFRVKETNTSLSATSSSESKLIFQAWLESTGKTGRTRLDAKRHRLIASALVNYPLEDVLDAVDGWRFDDWHKAERRNDLELILRDAGHIERFRDYKRHPQVKLEETPLHPVALTFDDPTPEDLERGQRRSAKLKSQIRDLAAGKNLNA